jgi:transposase
MFEERDTKAPREEEFWVEKRRLPAVKAGTFYRKLDETLREMEFAEKVREICRPSYKDASSGGRPGIVPAVYFKMLMIGFFENLPSERAIASRCEDSLSLRAFLGYDLAESTPDHSSLSVIRTRLGVEVYQGALEIVLTGLYEHGLLKGRDLGIDSSIIEANASLRELQHRNTEEAYWEYVKKLAAEAGIDPDDTGAVRRFDKRRKGRRTSNEDWVNPHDPDAKVGRTKDGACDMVYQPEHLTDLETGAIIRAEVRTGDRGDSQELSGRVLEGCRTLAQVCEDPMQEKVGRSLTADEGYFSVEEVCALQGEGIRTVMGDPHGPRRNKDKQCKVTRQTLNSARRAVKSKSGKALLKRRGEHLERSFAHLLDHGGLRRATLRGAENLTKRQIAAAMAYDLSLLMRKIFGFGTPKQWAAMSPSCLVRLLRALLRACGDGLTAIISLARKKEAKLTLIDNPLVRA